MKFLRVAPSKSFLSYSKTVIRLGGKVTLYIVHQLLNYHFPLDFYIRSLKHCL